MENIIQKAFMASAAKLKKSDLTEKLETVNDSYRRYYDILPNPTKLIGQLGSYNLFQETFADPHVRGCVNSIFEAITSLEYEIIKNGASAAEVALAQQTIEQLMSNNLIRQILWAIFYGSQYLNLLWKRGKYMTIDEIIELPHDAFVYDVERNLRVLTDTKRATGELIQPYRILAPTYEPTWKNPYGNGLFVNCYKKVFIKNNVADFWAVFTETFGSPGVSATYSQQAAALAKKSIDEYAIELGELLEDMVQNKVIVLPEGVTSNLFPAGSSGSSDIYNQLIIFCDKQISILILGHEGSASSTPGKLGSEDMALSTKTDRVEAYTKFIVNYINKLLKWQHELNFSGNKHCQIRFFELDDIEKYQSKANLLQTLKNCGVSVNEDYISEQFNIDAKYFTLKQSIESEPKETTPETTEPEDTLDEAKVKPKKQGFHALKILAQDNNEPELQDEFADELLKSAEFKSLKDATIDAIAEFVENAESLEEMNDKLFDIYDDLPLEDKKDFIYRMITTMEAYGYHKSESE
jgi:phage gp29-like protein